MISVYTMRTLPALIKIIPKLMDMPACLFKRIICIWCALFFISRNTSAQWVSYSEPTGRVGEEERMAGKSGNNYWILKITPPPFGKKAADIPGSWEQHLFEIYDYRLRFIKKVNNKPLPFSTKKIYAASGTYYLDLIYLTDNDSSTHVWRRRYTPEGDLTSDSLIAIFPFKEPMHRFLALRSQNRKRLLLLGFESVEDASPNVHAILLEENGQVRWQHKYHHPSLTQPMIQDEEFGSPVEHFSNAPIQLLNNGDWITILPSRTGMQYELFHFPFRDTGFVVRSVKKPPRTTLEDLVLTVNNERKTAAAGVLSRFTYRSLKNVQVMRYDLSEKAILLDTSYRFNALLADKVSTRSLVKEHLTSVPGSGFALLREYGRQLDYLYDGVNLTSFDGNELIASNGLSMNDEPVKKDKKATYFRSAKLGGMRTEFERGDLSIFFFPSLPGDSCWSGLINKEQNTEFNSPYLSYLMIPAKGKLHFLNNDFHSPWKQFGSSTVLDEQGKLYDGEGTVFWKFQHVLLFQLAVRIDANEIGIPYRWNERTGFSIIRF